MYGESGVQKCDRPLKNLGKHSVRYAVENNVSSVSISNLERNDQQIVI